MKSSFSISKGAGSINHNIRNFISKNVDKTRTPNNIVLINKDIKKVYDETFGEALKKYNAKQKYSSRTIKSYYEKINHSKQEKPFYELIFQIGDKDNPDTLNQISPKVLAKTVKVIKEKYHNIIIIGAYIHLDEKTPHLHLDYIPVCHNQKRGLETRNSHNLAMKEMGFSDYRYWRENLMEVFVSVAKEYGIEREYMNNTNKHLSVQEYKDVMQEIKMANSYLEYLEERASEKREEITEQQTTDKLVEGIYRLQLNYEYAKKDLESIQKIPTVENINRINNEWENPVATIYSNDSIEIKQLKANELIEWLKELIKSVLSLFYDILGKPYERVVEETREQIKEDFEKEFE